jgi:chitinase
VNGTASADVDYGAASGTLSFAPGQTVKNIAVPIYDVGPKPTATFEVSLGAATNATVADGTALVVIGARASDAVAQPALSAAADVAVDEGDGYVDLPVRLSAPGETRVSVAYATVPGTAGDFGGCNSGDYVGRSGMLVFAPGETAKVVRIQLTDCAIAENLETFSFTLSAPVNATIARSTTLISITENGTSTPNNTALPPLNGTAQVGQMLTAAAGTWAGTPTGVTYAWERCDRVGGACAAIAGATGPTYQLASTDVGHTIRVVETDSNAFGPVAAYSLPSAVVFGFPGAPQNVSASAGNGQVYVYFDPPAAGGAFTSYTVTVQPGGATFTGTSSPILVTGLTNGVSYTFTVTATNAAGTGPASAQSNAASPARRPPAPPDPPAPTPRPAVPEPPSPPAARPPKPSH